MATHHAIHANSEFGRPSQVIRGQSSVDVVLGLVLTAM